MRACGQILVMLLGLVGTSLAAQETDVARSDNLALISEAQAHGDIDAARTFLLEMLVASPDDPDLLRRLAMLEASDENFDSALKRINEAARLAPTDLDVALARGFILYWRGNAEEARLAANAIAAVDPNYPELGELNAGLARQAASKNIRLRSLFAGSGISNISTTNSGSQTWTNQHFGTAADISQNDTIALAVRREDRGLIDTRLSARVDHRIDQGFIHFGATMVPNPDFQERWSVSAGGEKRINESTAFPLDLRVANYTNGTIIGIQAGLRFRVNQDLAITTRAINVLGGDEGYRFGGAVRADFAQERETSLFLIAASYPDAEEDGVRQLRSLAAGIELPVAQAYALTIAGSYENREKSYRRYEGAVTLTYRFER